MQNADVWIKMWMKFLDERLPRQQMWWKPSCGWRAPYKRQKKKNTWTLLLAFVSCHKLRLTLFFLLDWKPSSACTFHFYITDVSGSTSVRSPYTTASGNQTFLYHFFWNFCDAARVKIASFIPLYSHTFLVCTNPFRVQRKRTIFSEWFGKLLFFRGNFGCFFPKSCYIDFYFTLRNSF